MMDGSLLSDGKTPASYEYNVDITCRVCEINIDTDIRLAMTGAMRQLFAQQLSEFDSRKVLLAAKNAARGIVKTRFEAIGCAGRVGADQVDCVGGDDETIRLILGFSFC